MDLTLVIPDLLPTLEGADTPDFPIPRAPGLQRLLSRAVQARLPRGDLDFILLHLFGMTAPDPKHAPVAPITYLADGGEPANAWVLRADPVYLRADRDRVLLFDARVLNLTAEEAEALADEFNRYFAERRWRLEPRNPQRWYLKFAADPGLRAQPLSCVVGRDIYGVMPTDGEGLAWRSMLNEVQMLFHGSPVNEDRERRGLLPVKGLWFWGGGHLPKPQGEGWTAVYGEHPLGVGLARLNKVRHQAGVGSALALLGRTGQAGRWLVIVEAFSETGLEGDAFAWKASLERFDQVWIQPILQALKAGTLSSLDLYPGNGRRYRVTRTRLRRFWKRKTSILTHLPRDKGGSL